MTPRDLFHRLRAALVRPSEPLPRDVREWLLDGLAKYDGSVALDVLLGLRGPGVRTIGTADRLARRNAHLWIARAEFSHGGNPQTSERQKDAIFAARVSAFRRKWPRLRKFDEPPPDLDSLDRHLFLAFRAAWPPDNRRALLRVARRL